MSTHVHRLKKDRLEMANVKWLDSQYNLAFTPFTTEYSVSVRHNGLDWFKHILLTEEKD